MEQFKASSILYSSSAINIFAGVFTPMLEMMVRCQDNAPDTIIEMMEWNPWSQLGLICLVQGLFLFWLGLMVDRRGA